MKEAYENLTLSLLYDRMPKIVPMKFRERYLDVSRMMSMMAASDKDGPTLLYMEVRVKSNVLV